MTTNITLLYGERVVYRKKSFKFEFIAVTFQNVVVSGERKIDL